MTTAWDTIDALEYELNEARSEIARHHRDFKRIQERLTKAEARTFLSSSAVLARLIRDIRNIVG